GTAYLSALRVARGALLYAARACGPGLDRRVDASVGRPHTSGAPRRARCAFHQGGAGEAHADDQRHQRLEPAGSRLRPLGRPAGGAGGGVIQGAGFEDAADSFDPLRPTLTRVAYRMLGSVADAEDVVQDAFLRWMRADRADVREPEAFLRR